MTRYVPDRAVLLKVTPADKSKQPIYKIFASWSGSYIHGSSWRINSGISSVVDKKDGSFDCYGLSGSVYNVRLDSEGMSVYSESVMKTLEDEMERRSLGCIEILPLSDLSSLNSVLQSQNGNSSSTSS